MESKSWFAVPRSVLVTGGTGFVGPVLIKRLLEEGDSVSVLVRRRAHGNRSNRLADMGLLDDVQVLEGDTTNLTSLIFAIEKARPDVIFHLAGQSYVPRSFSDPLETFQVNGLGTQNLLEAMRLKQSDAVFVFSGSSEEYGLQIASKAHLKWAEKKYGSVSPPPTRLPELPVNETNFLRPMSPYAVSKAYGDYLSRTYFHAYGLKCVVSRAFNHEGAGRGPEFVTSSLARQAVQLKMGERESLSVGNVNATRDWSHVEDIVSGYDLLSRKGGHGEIYVMGSARCNTVLSFLLCCLEHAGFDASKVATLDGRKVIVDPLEKAKSSILGIRFDHFKADEEVISGRASYSPQDKGLLIGSGSSKVRVLIDKDRFRQADVPLLMSDPTKIEELGFRAKRTIKDIIADQFDYYLNPSNRRE